MIVIQASTSPHGTRRHDAPFAVGGHEWTPRDTAGLKRRLIRLGAFRAGRSGCSSASPNVSRDQTARGERERLINIAQSTPENQAQPAATQL
ncbi:MULTISPECIES: hypothetical protein [unclassified Bradyrhizobium]|uniref:hypothetical protein n=1 Tax=unclassified Bradyrhizobium TaxID=2631580 RepID=UPI002915D24E|nr:MULTISPECIES: hypothetical protein [unclassified Bradyrhizobium]